MSILLCSSQMSCPLHLPSNSCIVVDNEQTLNDLLDVFDRENIQSIVEWLTTYWYVPVLIVVAILIIMFLLHVTYQRRRPIKRGLRRVRTSMRRGSQETPNAIEARGGVRERRRDPGQLSQREALNRLRGFFPTADSGILLDVMQQTGDESRAVKKILDLGYPLRKVPIPRA